MKSRWTCPKCGRDFANKNQWHSCVTMKVDDLLEDKPKKVEKTLKKLIRELKRLGAKVEVVKTSIILRGWAQFGAVYVLKSGVKLEFTLDRKIDDSRFEKVWPEPISGRYAYRVKLKGEGDVDKQLLRWLKDAYLLKS